MHSLLFVTRYVASTVTRQNREVTLRPLIYPSSSMDPNPPPFSLTPMDLYSGPTAR